MATDVKYGETRDLVFVPTEDGVAQSGVTSQVLIRRVTDGYSWSGSSFVSGDNWLSMSEIGTTGQYIYSITFPLTDTDIQALYRVVALEILVSEDIYVRDIPEWSEIQSAITTSESNIRGSDGDDLKSISDDIDVVQTGVTAIYTKTDAGTPSPTIPAQITTHDSDIKADILQHDTDIKALPNVKATPEFLTIPTGNTRIDQESGIDAVVTTIPVADVSSLQTEGVLLFGTEYIQYTGISVNNELTGCTRGAYGSTASTHADGEQGYEVTIYPLRLMVSDNQGNMIAPDSAPTIEIVDWNGAVEIPSTAMTLISIGLYGYNYFVVATDIPEPKVVRFSITVNSITTLRQSTLMMLDRPASQTDITQIIGGGTGEFVVTQDGYFDSNNIFHAWTDVMAGYLRDATSGARLDDVLVTAYSVINGQTVYAKIPPGQTVCDENGNYEMRLDAGTYTFKFYKDQYRFPTDEVERVVTS